MRDLSSQFSVFSFQIKNMVWRSFNTDIINCGKVKRHGINILAMISLLCVGGSGFGQDIIPIPQKMQKSVGSYELGSSVAIRAGRGTEDLAEQLRNYLRPATGLLLPIGSKGSIQLALDPSLKHLGEEGYTLKSSNSGIEIRASGEAGIFYGIQTLRQLLPPDIFRASKVSGTKWTVPFVTIEDSPRFTWRGSHVDECRHFMGKDAIKKHLDLLALHKINTFHWHLTDDQGWRIEIKKYPRLTEVGGWRETTMIPPYQSKPEQRRYDGIPHGGFHTQDDIREIINYAAERYINIVPEIEMPGHARAALAAYPHLGNFPEQNVTVSPIWGVFREVFNVEDGTIQFLKDVLDEVMSLFPSKFIHVGGDECPKYEWARSESALTRMKQVGLVTPSTTLKDLQNYVDASGKKVEHPALHALQSWFVKQFDTYLTSKGRRLIGWDEILDGGLAPGATVMSWRGEAGGIAAANAGHDVVMASNGYLYLDYYQQRRDTPGFREPWTIGGFIPLEKTYSFEPIPAEIAPDKAKHVLGAQGQLWAEYIINPRRLEYMAWPRLAALSEVVWSPAEKKNFQDFESRIKTHFQRLKVLGVNYRPLDGPAWVFPEFR
ncbi:MAG: beta-N-acetylhexosaminidase [Holophagaceae bacterium]|nr:beta-N-acetylhexosaminidase [Holophagaceae bacterium]